MKIFNKIKNLFKKIPITTILIYIVSFIFLIFGYKGFIRNILLFLVFSIIPVYFIEVRYKRRNIYLIPVVLSIILVYLYNTIDHRVVYNIVIFIYLVLILTVIWKYKDRNKIDIFEYIYKVIIKLFYVTITYIVISMGVFIVGALFIWLMNLDYNDLVYSIYYKVLFIPTLLYYIPSILNIIISSKDRDNDIFIRTLSLYVISPITLFMILVIYLYNIRILISGIVPSNLISRVLMCIFVIVIGDYILCINNKDSKISRLGKINLYLYIPLIILEGYALILRVYNYGITPIRYFGILFIILEVIILISIFMDRDRVTYYGLIVLSLIYLISPFNYISVSMYSQERLVDKYIKTNNGLYTARGAFSYLEGEKLANDYINKIPDNIKSRLRYEDTPVDDNISYYSNLDNLDIGEYSYISTYDYNSSNIDVSRIIEDIRKHNSLGDNINDYIKNLGIIKIDDNTGLYITDLYLDNNNYNTSISGYILKK